MNTVRNGRAEAVTSLALDTVGKNGPQGAVKLLHKAWSLQSCWSCHGTQLFPLHPPAAVLLFAMASYSWQTTWEREREIGHSKLKIQPQ